MKILSFMVAVAGVAGVACADDFPVAASRLDGELAKIYGGTPSGNLAAVRFEKAGWADGQRYEIASSRGVRVPRDVRIVSRTNAGMRPPFTCSLACLEFDLDASANVVSKAMLDFLVHGRRVEGGRTIGCAYVPGETFPAGDLV